MSLLLLLACVGVDLETDKALPSPDDPDTGEGDTAADTDTDTAVDTDSGGDSDTDTAADTAPDTDTAGDTGGDTAPRGEPGRRFEGGGEYTASDDSDATVSGGVGYWIGAGDLDGDGRADLVTGQYDTRTTRLYREIDPGDALTSLDAFATVTGTDPNVLLGWRGASPGDLTGDGADDLVLAGLDGDGVVLAGPFSGAYTQADACCRLDAGTVFAGVDPDGDGARALLVGDPGADADAGAAYLLAAPLVGDVTVATDAVTTIAGEGAWRVGGGLANVGDLDGDGADDLAVVASGSDLAGEARGAVFLFHAPPSGTLAARDADVTITPSTSSSVGGAFGGPADLDADGYADLVFGHQGAWIFAGPVAAGALTELDATAIVDTGCGRAAVEAGTDLDGDGPDDLVVGCASESRNSWADLYYGPLAGTIDRTLVDAVFYDSGYYDRFGAAIAGADLDADGLEDLAFADGDTGGGGQWIYVFLGGL